MKTIFATAIALYLLWVAGYLMAERFFRRRKKQRQPMTDKPAKKMVEDDIIVKGTFTLRHSQPQAASAPIQEKALENDSTFAPLEEEKPSARIPDEALDETFSHNGEESLLMEISVPLEYEYGYAEPEDFSDEEEEPWLQGNVMLAESSSFEEMAAAVRTVVHHQIATQPEKEKAGGVLVAIRQTDLFEQLVQSAPGRVDIVGEVMNLHLDAYRRQLAEEAEVAGTGSRREAPRNFDVNDFV